MSKMRIRPAARALALHGSFPAGLPLARPVPGVLAGLLGAALFAILTGAGAAMRIPLQPVPVTLQTLFVILSGAVLGAGRGAMGQSFYLLLGVLGVPFFAGSAIGLAALAGPTGGYLAGFLVAPVVVGRLIGLSPAHSWHVIVFATGSLVILFLGVLHLALFYTHDIAAAVQIGLLPFLVGDAFKVLAAASIYASLARLGPGALNR